MANIIIKKRELVLIPKEQITVHLSRFDLVKNHFRLKGEPFDFTGKDYIKPMVNRRVGKKLFKTARQVEKSSIESYDIASKLISNRAYRMTYIAPVWKQAKTFSKDRVLPIIHSSPFVYENYAKGKNVSLAVENVVLNNFSTLYVRSTFGSGADSIRGLSNDELFYDEIQDILWDDVPVINECLSHSAYKNEFGENGFITYAGTPKTKDNTIEFLWQGSTQNKLGVKCGCGHWILGGGVENISDAGFICDKCGRLIDIKNATKHWIQSYEKTNLRQVEGYHLSQLMMPWIPWNSIVNKFKGADAYPTNRFMNEVLGESYDDSTKVFTYDDFRDRFVVPHPDVSSWDDIQKLLAGVHTPMYLGVDWGTGGTSFTTLVISVQTADGSITPILMKKLRGVEAQAGRPTELIQSLMRRHSNMYMGLDYGAGFFENGRLMEEFGPDRVFVMYHSHSSGDILRYNHSTRIYTTNRSDVMTDLFTRIKNRSFRFMGTMDMFKDFIPDFLAVTMEYNENARKYVYKHSPSAPDDTVHASIYSLYAYLIQRGLIHPVLVSGEEKQYYRDSDSGQLERMY